MVHLMSTFLLTVLGLAAGSSYPCAVRREIAPCTCRLQEPKLTTIVVACEQMASFHNIVELLHNKFPIEQDISLKISFSNLDDLAGKTFNDLGMSVTNLNLNFDDLSYLQESSFAGLEGVEYLSLADNRLSEIPRNVLRRMPKLKTLDIGRSRVYSLTNDDFKDLPTFWHLILPGNDLSRIETHSLPKTVRRLHLGRNNLRDLNNSIRALTDLEWFFVNGNELETLEGQLPPEAPKLILLHAANNRLKTLPIEIRNYPSMDSLFFHNNDIELLNGALQRSRRLKRLHLTFNKIHTLADDDFADTELMDDIQLGFNQLTQLNGAFAPMRKLRTLNLTHNHLHEFSIQEIRGLQNLKLLDLSYNKIQLLGGQMENAVELETRVEELHLEFNQLTALRGALQGIHGLQRLYINNNKLQVITPDDLIGLDDLRVMDISYNHLTTLEETSKTFLPRLYELIANNNHLTTLAKDFHGLPVLCRADLSNNHIATLGLEVGSKSRCRSGGLLIVALFGNPVLCDPDYSKSAELVQRNMTLLQGDLSICPTTTTSTTTTTTTTTTTEAPTTTSTPATTTITNQLSVEEPPINLAILIRQPPPQVVPLQYSPEVLSSQPVKEEVRLSIKEEAAKTPLRDFVEAITSTTPVHEATTESNVMQLPPMMVIKDEGQNVTLVIGMENGVLKKDQYIKIDETPQQDQKTRAATITNIEIVDIKPLPENATSIVLAPPHEENLHTKD